MGIESSEGFEDAPGLLKKTPAPPGAPEPAAAPARLRDRRESDRSPANHRKWATAYFVEATGRAWCPPGDFERRLQRTVAGRPLVAVEAKLGLLLRCIEAGLMDHREARAKALVAQLIAPSGGTP